MIGVLIVAGIIFYAVLYSGVQDLKGNKTSILEALTGKGQGQGASGSGGPPTKIAHPTKTGGKV